LCGSSLAVVRKLGIEASASAAVTPFVGSAIALTFAVRFDVSLRDRSGSAMLTFGLGFGRNFL
jgi:hypothetical protein